MNPYEEVLTGLKLALASHSQRMVSQYPLGAPWPADRWHGLNLCLNCFNAWQTPTSGQLFWCECTQCKPGCTFTRQTHIQLDDVYVSNVWQLYGAVLMIQLLTGQARVDYIPPGMFEL